MLPCMRMHVGIPLCAHVCVCGVGAPHVVRIRVREHVCHGSACTRARACAYLLHAQCLYMCLCLCLCLDLYMCLCLCLYMCLLCSPNPLPMCEAFTTISPHYREAVRPPQARLSTVIPDDDLPFNEYRSIFGKGLSAMSHK